MKLFRKTIIVLLAVALIIGFVPVTEMKYGEGIQAATVEEIIDDALSWAVQLDEYGQLTSTPIVNYVYGGLDLNVGVDCSGFVCAIFNRHGLDLVSMGIRSTYDMLNNYSKFGTKLDTTDISAIKSGDIIITNGGGHVGIAWMNGDTPMFIHSQNYGTGVVVQPLEMYMRSSGIVAIIRPNAINGVKVNPIKGPGPLSTTNYGDTTIGTKDDPNAFAYDNPGAPFAIPTVTIAKTKPDDVKWLQKALNNVMTLSLTVDGVLNDKTVAEIKNFQKKYGYKQSGTADKTVINKLVELHKQANQITSLKLYLKRSEAEKYVPALIKARNTDDESSGQDESVNDNNSSSDTKSSESDKKADSNSASSDNTDTKASDASASGDAEKTEEEKDPNELLEIDELELREDDTVTLITKYVPETAKNVTLKWESSDTEVVKVSEKGELVAVDGGTAEVTVKVQEKTAKIKVTVIASIHRNEWRNGKWYNYAGEQSYTPRGEWKSNYYGIWYQDTSGWYPYSEWVKIDGRWYYFNSSGYAYKNGWSQVGGTWYYFRSSGMMAESEWVNGYWLSAGGSWSYQYTGSWMQNSKGWWFEDTSGWYPKDETVKINGVEYQFDEAGYWIQ